MTVPSYNKDAELSVLGCILSAASYSPVAGKRILARVRNQGLTAGDFWLQTNGTLYALLEQRADQGLTLDPVSVAAAIEDEAWRRLGAYADLALTGAINGEILRAKLEMLAAGVTAFGNCEAHAAIVVRNSQRRAQAAA